MIESGRSPHIEPIVFFNSLDARKSRLKTALEFLAQLGARRNRSNHATFFLDRFDDLFPIATFARRRLRGDVCAREQQRDQRQGEYFFRPTHAENA